MKEECKKHKWKYLGFYNGGYYNHKECIHCHKLEIERNTKKVREQKKEVNNGRLIS